MKELGISIDPSPAGTGVAIWVDGDPRVVEWGACRGVPDWRRFWEAVKAVLPQDRTGIKAVIVREGTPTGFAHSIAHGLISVAAAKGELTGFLAARLLGCGVADVQVRELSVSEWRKLVLGPGAPKSGEAQKAAVARWVDSQWPSLLADVSGSRSKKAKGDRADSVGVGAAYYGYGAQSVVKRYVCNQAGMHSACGGCRHSVPTVGPVVHAGVFPCPEAKGMTMRVRLTEVTRV